MAKLRVSLYLFLVGMLIFSTQPVLHAQTPDATSVVNPFLSMLSLAPDNPTMHTDGIPFSYVDYRAAEAVLGITKPASTVAYLASDKDSQSLWMDAVARIVDNPTEIPTNLNLKYEVAMSSVVGFDWFDIDRKATYGTPPHQAWLFVGNFDASKIDMALSARNFKKNDVNNVPLWSRFGDGTLNAAASDKADPFGGALGQAARVALLPGGIIVNSPFTDDTKLAIATYNHTQKTVADDPDYHALAGAITDPQTYQGSLIQAIFVTSAWTFKMDSFVVSEMPQLRSYGNLPAYTLAVLADRQEGQTQISMIALAYSDQNAAQQASVELQSRITSFDTEKIDKLTSAKVDPGYVYQDANGQYVAVVVVRYPLPSTQRDPSTSGRIPPGMVFYLWNSTLMQAKFYLLTSGMPSQ